MTACRPLLILRLADLTCNGLPQNAPGTATSHSAPDLPDIAEAVATDIGAEKRHPKAPEWSSGQASNSPSPT